jgi:predicted GH43/DUF377 family glycosyl hydrolase
MEYKVLMMMTMAKDRYDVANGTSAAAPIVSGVVGLVKSLNPGWSGVQAAEKVRVTADSLYAYPGLVGRGRINAYRALTEDSPSIRFLDYYYEDEDKNGLIEPGERVELRVQVINYLSPASDIKVTLSSSSGYVTFINDQITLSSMGTLEQITVSEPFVFDVANKVYGNPHLKFVIKIQANGYEDIDRFSYGQIFPKKLWNKPVKDPVLEPGKSGEWDELSVSVQSVIFDTLNAEYKLWYQGAQVSLQGNLGQATSADGLNWVKYKDNPVLEVGPPGSWDDFSVGVASVIMEDSAKYHMWYTGTSDQTTISIGYATSYDGLNWVKYIDNPVLEPGSPGSWDGSWVIFPSVLFDGSMYKMWYTGYSFENWHGRIGYATSFDGIHWDKFESNPVLDVGLSYEWDSNSVFSPFIIDEEIFEIWYAGSNDSDDVKIGHATSHDGIKWIKNIKNPVLPTGSSGEWDFPRVQNPKVLKISDNYHMWYTGGPFFNWHIGYATSLDPTSVIRHNMPIINARRFYLLQNFPNPFNPVTMINYQIPTTSEVKLSVYNLLGQKVATLVNSRQQAGYHQVEWDANQFSSGVYYYRIEVVDPVRRSGDFQDAKKMILLK